MVTTRDEQRTWARCVWRTTATAAIAAAVAVAGCGGGGQGGWWSVDSNGEAYEELLIYLNDPIVPLKAEGGTHYSGATRGTFHASVNSARRGPFTFTTEEGAVLPGRVAAGGAAFSRNSQETRDFAAAEVLRLTGREINIDSATFHGVARRDGGSHVALRGKLSFRGTLETGAFVAESGSHGHLRLRSRMERTDSGY